ncbi:ATP-binding protein [Streptomyces sp. SP18BB07]|uniref:ATP-binding protein n=1 Tax=Streptomyces sp. SP18BB07 TaxID=3002522 RepID=UPI002E7975BB|nr:ATP-binding protein [Streptomyces sp. SP18BB07]MEE1765833.1 ATP-binding protein [Streptomyces sp. SP18BB07]
MPKYALDCPPLDTTPRIARDFVASVLRALRLDALADDAVLCTSELVTNSCRHAKSSGAHLLLIAGPEGPVRVTVYDDDRTPPSLHQGYDGESGRGLWIVDTVTEGRWGTEALGASGKGVWFEVGKA